jgi:hypothetical protein
MATPLTKISKAGSPYVRTPSVESSIDRTVNEDLAALRKRLELDDESSPDYLKSECLVHLFREFNRRNEHEKRDIIVTVIFTRIERLLLARYPDNRIRNAAQIRDEILGKFALMLANDGRGSNPDELDFYECRFNRAFRTFRIDVLKHEKGQETRFSQFPDEAPTGDEKAAPNLGAIPSSRAKQEDALLRAEMLNSLSPDLRRAVVLVHEMGYEIESEDDTKITAATICGVSGRTIRTRLKLAKDFLKQRDQEGS